MPKSDRATVAIGAAAGAIAAGAAAYLCNPSAFASFFPFAREPAAPAEKKREEDRARKADAEEKEKDAAAAPVEPRDDAKQEVVPAPVGPPAMVDSPERDRPAAGATPGVAPSRRAKKPEPAEATSPNTPLQSDLGAIRDLLAKTHLSEFLAQMHVGRPECAPPARDVLTLTPSVTVDVALRELAERSVVSAPLLRDDGKDYLGFVSVHDIVHALVAHIFPPGPMGYCASVEAPEWFLIDDTQDAARRTLKMIHDKAPGFCARELGSIRRGPEGGDGAWILASGSSRGLRTDDGDDPSMLHVIQHQFIPRSPSVSPLHHRVAVYRYVDDGPESGGKVEVTDIISLSDITRFLMRWDHIEHCITPCSAADLGLGAVRVDVVSSDSSLLRCFALMSRFGVSGLGVTEARDASGARARDSWPPKPTMLPVGCKIIGNISESDLRRITPEHLEVLAMPVGAFIEKLNAKLAAGGERELRDEPLASARAHPLFSGMLTRGELSDGKLCVTARHDASLLDVMRAMARNRVHRVYLCDEDTGVAKRVVTHSDLVRFFAMFAPAEDE